MPIETYCREHSTRPWCSSADSLLQQEDRDVVAMDLPDDQDSARFESDPDPLASTSVRDMITQLVMGHARNILYSQRRQPLPPAPTLGAVRVRLGIGSPHRRLRHRHLGSGVIVRRRYRRRRGQTSASSGSRLAAASPRCRLGDAGPARRPAASRLRHTCRESSRARKMARSARSAGARGRWKSCTARSRSPLPASATTTSATV